MLNMFVSYFWQQYLMHFKAECEQGLSAQPRLIELE